MHLIQDSSCIRGRGVVFLNTAIKYSSSDNPPEMLKSEFRKRTYDVYMCSCPLQLLIELCNRSHVLGVCSSLKNFSSLLLPLYKHIVVLKVDCELFDLTDPQT